MSTNVYNGNITNNGTFNNDCFNTHITNNFNIRVNLESRAKDGKLMNIHYYVYMNMNVLKMFQTISYVLHV